MITSHRSVETGCFSDVFIGTFPPVTPYKLYFMLSTLGKNQQTTDRNIFFLFSPRKVLTVHANYLQWTIFMKCQMLFSGKNAKNIIILSSAELAQRVVKVNFHFALYTYICTRCHYLKNAP